MPDEQIPLSARGPSDPEFDARTARLMRREALRRAAAELNKTSGPGLEDALARISAEVTAEAAYQHAKTGGTAGPAPAGAPLGAPTGAPTGPKRPESA